MHVLKHRWISERKGGAQAYVRAQVDSLSGKENSSLEVKSVSGTGTGWNEFSRQARKRFGIGVYGFFFFLFLKCAQAA